MSDAADPSSADNPIPSDSQPKSPDRPQEKSRRVIKIGSQRPGHENTGRVVKTEKPKPTIEGSGATTWTPPEPQANQHSTPSEPVAAEPAPSEPVAKIPAQHPRQDAPVSSVATPSDVPPTTVGAPDESDAETLSSVTVAEVPATPKTDFASPPPTEAELAAQVPTYPKPRVSHLSPELQQEIDAALEGVSLDGLMTGEVGMSVGADLPIDSRVPATVVKVHREDVFFRLPGNLEAITPLKHFTENPEVGAELEVVINRINPEDGLYEVSLPGTTAAVEDWSDLQAGMTVEAKVTGHNTGGLECNVNGIRAFMPVSQISMYRVEDLAQFVDEKWACVVNEANPERGNLVISRRAVLEREKAAAGEKLMEGLQVGQEHEGIVRSIRDFGAFVDLGGIDGLIHVSKLSWDRITHPKDVLSEGEKVKVRIEKIENGKIGLSYRDVGEHPWKKAADEFVPNAIVDGTVTKIMDFGAFVKLAPGIEGLVHISELAHHRVVNVANVVSEGQEVRVKILSVDTENQRMSLSMKAMQAPPEKASGKSRATDSEDEPPRESAVKKFEGKLKGGTNKNTGGEQFGLKW